MVNGDDITDVAPDVVASLARSLTFSNANGIGVGFVTFSVVNGFADTAGDFI